MSTKIGKRKAKAKRNAVNRAGNGGTHPAAAAADLGEFPLGKKVKLIRGAYMSSIGAVEAVGSNGVTVRVHARLAVTVPPGDVQAV